jgi:phenylalanine-4-hydroxylase
METMRRFCRIESIGETKPSAYNITESNSVKLEFEGNITVEGEIITGSRNLQGEIILIRFKNCTVTHGETICSNRRGVYDMAVGKK